MVSSFVVEGLVDGAEAMARWEAGTLAADSELRRRIEVVVALGEEFRVDDGDAPVLVASVDGDPAAVLLTVVRAFSQVRSVHVAMRSHA